MIVQSDTNAANATLSLERAASTAQGLLVMR
jgi:hypothetical protein